MALRRLTRHQGKIDAAIVVVILAAAFLLTIHAGSRGFMAFDQSIAFDGGYRLLSGQVLYKDFVAPFGLLLYAIVAVAFRILGTNYTAYVVCAALMNVLAASSAMYIVRSLRPDSRNLTYVAGIITAVWFYPPVGTPTAEQTAFLILLLAWCVVLRVLKGHNRSQLNRGAWVAIAGFLAFASLLAKQNAGLILMPVLPLTIMLKADLSVRQKLSLLAWFSSGMLVGAGMFVLWLYTYSDPQTFVRFALQIPGGEGIRRLFTYPAYSLHSIAIGRAAPGNPPGPKITTLCMYVAFVPSLIAAVFGIRRRKALDRAGKEAVGNALICVQLLLSQNLFIATMMNEPVSGYGLFGIIFALGLSSLHWLGRSFGTPGADKHRRPVAGQSLRAIVLVFILACGLGLIERGLRVSRRREAHDVFRGATFPLPTAVAGFNIVKWGEPTRTLLFRRRGSKSKERVVEGPAIQRHDVERLVAYLRENDGNFFVLRDWTVLYGLVGRQSPQPLLCFYEGLTYPVSGAEGTEHADPEIEQWIIRDLERNAVQRIVLEDSWGGAQWQLDLLPLLRHYVETRFAASVRFGVFEVWERIPTIPPL